MDAGDAPGLVISVDDFKAPVFIRYGPGQAINYYLVDHLSFSHCSLSLRVSPSADGMLARDSASLRLSPLMRNYFHQHCMVVLFPKVLAVQLVKRGGRIACTRCRSVSASDRNAAAALARLFWR
jgi:hypothetical protein